MPVVLPDELADTREVADTEYGLVEITLVVLVLALGSCTWGGGLSRLVVEFSAEGKVDTLLLAVVVVACDAGVAS